MPETELDALTYDKIMDFALLDPFAHDYYQRILSLLKTNFEGSLTAYSSWFKDGQLISAYSIGFTDEFMREAHNIYIQDEIRNLVIEQISSNSWNGVFYSQDVDPFTFTQSRLIAHLNRNHIHYFAFMILSRKPRVNILMCKTDKEGPFSKREKEIIRRVCTLLSRQVEIRETYFTNRNVLEIINSHCLNKKTGLIITDEEHTVLTYNEAALSLVPKNMNPKKVDDIVSWLFSMFEKNEINETDREESEQSITRNGRVYTMETIRLSDEEGSQIPYHLFTIRRNRHYDSEVDLNVSASYGLTERETGIARLLASGYSNDEIADQLHISVHTVKIHVSNLFRKLDVHSRMEAVMKLSDKG